MRDVADRSEATPTHLNDHIAIANALREQHAAHSCVSSTRIRSEKPIERHEAASGGLTPRVIATETLNCESETRGEFRTRASTWDRSLSEGQQFRTTCDQIPQLVPVALHVQKLEHIGGRLEGNIVSIVGASEHEGMLQFAEELRRPVVLEDGLLGPLTLDRRMGWFHGQTQWQTHTIKFYVGGETLEAAQQELATAHKLLANQAGWMDRVLQKAVDKLLDLHNDDWSEDDTPKTPAQFRELMKLESIHVETGGGFSFWFDDGDLFAGHAILVSGTIDEGPKYASIEG